MNLSLPSLLLGLGGKCALGWGLLLYQRGNVCSSFLGVFGVSLCLVDTALTLISAAIHFCARPPLVLAPDLQLTSFNACLLVQVLGQVYDALQWPVVLAAALDHLCSVSLPRPASPRARRAVYSIASALLWTLAGPYVFLLSGFRPVLEDVTHWEMKRCWVSHTPQVPQVMALLSSALASTALLALCRIRGSENSRAKERMAMQSRTPPRRSEVAAVARPLQVFLSTWAPLLVLLLVLLPVGIPSYLGLNVPWLCVLNSALIALVLCVAHPDPQFAPGLAVVPADSFCEWRIKFIPAAEDRTGRQRPV